MVLATKVLSSFQEISEKFVTIESFWAHNIPQDNQLESSGELHSAPLNPIIWDLLELDLSIIKTVPKQMFEKFENTMRIFCD